jgi:hypothetical protein
LISRGLSVFFSFITFAYAQPDERSEAKINRLLTFAQRKDFAALKEERKLHPRQMLDNKFIDRLDGAGDC